MSHLNRCTALFAGFYCTNAVRGADRSLIYNTPQGDIQPLKSGERSLAGRILIDPSRWNNSRSRVHRNNADLTMCTGQRFMIRYFSDEFPRQPEKLLLCQSCLPSLKVLPSITFRFFPAGARKERNRFWQHSGANQKFDKYFNWNFFVKRFQFNKSLLQWKIRFNDVLGTSYLIGELSGTVI